MYLQSLRLKNFRNFQSQKTELHPHFNIIIGQNAQGKTNLLEAIYYLGYLSSFRQAVRNDFLFYGTNEAFVECFFDRQEIEHVVRIVIEKQKRSVKLNGKTPKLYQEYFGLIPILLFEPKDVYLFRESPIQRRRYINKALFLDNSSLLRKLKEYEIVLAQKNRLLKEENRTIIEDQIGIWNEKLAFLGAGIIFNRLQWIKKINHLLSNEYQKISGGHEVVRIEYESSMVPQEGVMTEDFLYCVFQEMLQKRRLEEMQRRESMVGPHRDDWVTYLNGRRIGVLGSQGENRSALIALKSAQIHLFEDQTGFSPLFLLDDVASELDPQRQEALFSTLELSKGQVFLTTTKPKNIADHFKRQGLSFIVEEGKVRVLS